MKRSVFLFVTGLTLMVAGIFWWRYGVGTHPYYGPLLLYILGTITGTVGLLGIRLPLRAALAGKHKLRLALNAFAVVGGIFLLGVAVATILIGSGFAKLPHLLLMGSFLTYGGLRSLRRDLCKGS